MSLLVRPVRANVLFAGDVVLAALAESMRKPLPWAVVLFFFGNSELNMKLWTVIVGISGLDAWYFLVAFPCV